MDRKLNSEDTSDGVAFEVKVKPCAGKSAVEGIRDGALAVSVKAPPEGGKANREVEKLVAKYFGAGAGNVRITGGMKSRKKRVRITGLSGAELENRIKGSD